MKTLIVGVNRMSNKLLRALLATKDNRITIAGNGLEAISKFGRHTYDLVISEMLMPGIDGVILTRKIRQELNGKTLPVILYTGLYHADHFEKLALRSGATRFVKKNAQWGRYWLPQTNL